MVNTTGGPALTASIISPALTNGAVKLLQEHLTLEENELWTSLGTSWTSPRSLCMWMLALLETVHNTVLMTGSFHFLQLPPRCDCSSVYTCLSGWVETSDSWLYWPAFWRSHRASAQSRCFQWNQAETKSAGRSSTGSTEPQVGHWRSVNTYK